MINNCKTDKKTVIFYHGNCTDGFGGAYAAYKKFGDEAEYIPLDYKEGGATNTIFHTMDLKGKDVIMIDVSSDRETILRVREEANSFKLLDHHESAYLKIGDCEDCFFDLKKSGAMIAWEHFHETPVPHFIKLIEDGDLYKFKYPETKAFTAYIHNEPRTFKNWEKLENPVELAKAIEFGQILHQQHEKHVNDSIKEARPVKFMGHDIYMCNTTSAFTSDVGSSLAKKSGTFAICWQDKGENIKVSLRSVPGFSTRPIAELFGGGGHPQATAFRVKTLDEFIQLLKDNENTPVPSGKTHGFKLPRG